MPSTVRRSLFSLALAAVVVFAPGAGHIHGSTSSGGDPTELAARMLAPTLDAATTADARPTTVEKRSDNERARRAAVPSGAMFVLATLFASALLFGFSDSRSLVPRVIDLLAPKRRRAPPLLQPA